MKKAVFLPLVLACVSVAGAQTASVTATVREHPNNPTEVTVRNDSGSPITALAFSVAYPNQPQAAPHYVDFIVQKGVRQPVAPGGQFRISFGNVGRPATVELKAAVFADGTTYGDSAFVDGILQRRRGVLLGLNAMLEHLSTTPLQATSLPKLAAKFHAARENQLKTSRAEYRLGVATVNQAIDRTMQQLKTSSPEEAVTAVTAMLKNWQSSLNASLPSVGRAVASN